MRSLIFLAICTVLLLQASAAYAYIGPGAGAGAIAVVFGVLGSFFLALVAIVWYPIKRLIKGRKPAVDESKKAEPDAAE